jgi:hypothetical protein
VLPLVPTTEEVAMTAYKEISKAEISRRAYELFVQRGGEPGKDVEDWVRAERELSGEVVSGPVKTKAAQVRRFPLN